MQHAVVALLLATARAARVATPTKDDRIQANADAAGTSFVAGGLKMNGGRKLEGRRGSAASTSSATSSEVSGAPSSVAGRSFSEVLDSQLDDFERDNVDAPWARRNFSETDESMPFPATAARTQSSGRGGV